jgi:uncharacterized protein
MSITIHEEWDLSDRSTSDRQRHNHKVDDAIRKGIKDFIADSSIISEKTGKRVRIPIKGFREYRFIYGDNGEGSGGIGQGPGKPGDVIFKKKIKDMMGPGNNQGNGDMEVEVELDYLIKILFEELGLPFLEEKDKVQKYVPTGFKLKGISKVGQFSRLHKKRTVQESIKRTWSDIGEIIEETQVDDITAQCAYIQGNYDINNAIEIIQSNTVDMTIDVDNLLFIDDEDVRFRVLEQEFTPQSNAVVILMADRSGSMDRNKRFIARTICFWLVQFLKTQYESIELRFIVHDTEAKLVEEEEFLNISSSGGTYTAKAFDLATYLLENEYPKEEWNSYLFYTGDGEAFDVEESTSAIRYILENIKPNMLIYSEILPDADRSYYNSNLLMDYIAEEFPLTKSKSYDFAKNDDLRLYTGCITNTKMIWPFLKYTLFGESKK